MRRVPIEKRPNVARLVESQGLVYARPASIDDKNQYWPDNVYYSFTKAEIELLETASKDVFDMCCQAAEHLVAHPETITSRMAIPAFCLTQIKSSWDREPAWGSVYGRFDVCFGGLDHPDPRLRVPKFYEFNADTPTSLLESGHIQWLWLEHTGHGADQFNNICDQLREAWKRNLKAMEKEAFRGRKTVVHFSCSKGEKSGEDIMNTTLLMELCRQAGWTTKVVFVEDISLGPDGRFYDGDRVHIDVVFKLYPWEDMVRQDFGEACFKDMKNIGLHNEAGEYIGGTVWIEAPYKMLWSNKAVWAIIWDLFKDDPRSKWLLPTYFEDQRPASLTKFARKPIFSREGNDVTLQADGKTIDHSTRGWFGKEGHIVQELALLPEFKDGDGVSRWPVLGVWFIDGEPGGMGIREDKGPITTNISSFIPHSISDVPLNYERIPVPDSYEIEAALSLRKYATRSKKKGVDDVVGFIEEMALYI
ncbi:hypothetical protein N0V93_005879 [Gnomoniopsis smithogilvyi]|uniref:Glutathionylspermidine synthase pre-ATP-grasp-like domain-containing protein n=1 Tax=Gnomoniopsis smithogilvyi TaxID=1191159 RepID=A0A9W9CYG5_9PEZI|nr:hypothetical protein N0V93_005879 [Gnomoniopsis smithogilvyi]